MTIKKPYHRTCRQFSDGHYSEGGRSQYITHPEFAQHPGHYIRAFLLIQKDLQVLFDYVEPSDANLKCYSYRIHALLMRTCVEIEANCKAVLGANTYSKTKNLSMSDYKKLNTSHKLASYKVKFPIWGGEFCIRQPFKNWNNDDPLDWYSAYNKTKHNRHNEFKTANFEALVDAVSGLLIVLSAQFHTYDFSSGPILLAIGGGHHDDGMESAIGDHFRIEFPSDWSEEDCYSFDWQTLKDEEEPFQKFNYDSI